MDITWLQKLLDPNDSRPYLRQPFTASVNGKKYAAATNGNALTLIEGDFGLPLQTRPDIETLLRQNPPGPGRSVKLSDIKEWCGDPMFADGCKVCGGTNKVPCEDCDGIGYHDCKTCGQETQCLRCDGDKVEDCPEHVVVSDYIDNYSYFGRLHGVPVNRKLLARFLSGVSGDVVTICTNGSMAIHIIGDGWTVLVMPVREDAITSEIPEFN